MLVSMVERVPTAREIQTISYMHRDFLVACSGRACLSDNSGRKPAYWDYWVRELMKHLTQTITKISTNRQ
jgi:hypothetical protein